MNKMNLPAPFRAALPTPPLPPPLPPPVPFPSVGKRQAGELSSGESELESSDEVLIFCLTFNGLECSDFSCSSSFYEAKNGSYLDCGSC